MLDWTFFGRCLEFLAGMGMALYLRKNPGTGKKGFLFTVGGILVMVACMAPLVHFERNAAMSVAIRHMYNPWSFVFRNGLLPIVIVLFF